jgi:hypothetical protein
MLGRASLTEEGQRVCNRAVHRPDLVEFLDADVHPVLAD